MKKLSAYRLLVLPDMHVPVHDRKALSAVLKYAKDESFDEVIQIGDFMDMMVVSSHEKENARGLEGMRLEADYKLGREILDGITKAVQVKNSKCKRVLLEGNHEYRIERFIDKYPGFEGLVEIEKGLELTVSGWKWVRAWSKGDIYGVGNLFFTHGRYHNDHHAKTHATRYAVNLIYGHVHSIQTYSLPRFGSNKAVIARSIGCLCNLNQGYMRGAPTAWQQAVADIWVDYSGRSTISLIEISDGRFVAPNGKTYIG